MDEQNNNSPALEPTTAATTEPSQDGKNMALLVWIGSIFLALSPV